MIENDFNFFFPILRIFSLFFFLYFYESYFFGNSFRNIYIFYSCIFLQSNERFLFLLVWKIVKGVVSGIYIFYFLAQSSWSHICYQLFLIYLNEVLQVTHLNYHSKVKIFFLAVK